MDSSIRDRINLLRFVMIFGIVVLHTPEYVPIAQIGSDWFSLTKAFFQNAMFRTTVPVLTFVSGYLVFHAGLDQLPKKLAFKKVRSLLVPFLAFNLPVVAAVYLAELLTDVKTNYQLLPVDPAVWADAAFGLVHSPINYPLNFLRDMLVLMCLAPLMGFLIRKAPLPGFVLVSIVFLTNFDGILVLRDVMPVLFYIGGLAAYQKWNLHALDRFAWLSAVLFLLLCALTIHFRIANTNLLRLVSPLLVWPACTLLLSTRLGAWCTRMNRYSFFIFVAHAPVLFATWIAYKKLGHGLPYPVYWVSAPVTTTTILLVIYHVGMRVAPKLFSAALGYRSSGGQSPTPGNAAKSGAAEQGSAAVLPPHLDEHWRAQLISQKD